MAPLLQEKFNTNYIPTSAETRLIQNELAQSKEHLSLLDAEIGRLQDRCNQLYVDKERLSIGIAMARGALAPARRLIPEILREIFCHCLPTNRNAAMSVLEAPLLLGRVCSYWRQIAYSTPRLWASLHIVIPSTDPYDPLPPDNTFFLAAVSQWLARSGVLPLSISMISRHALLTPNGRVQPFLDLLGPFVRRWRSVSFRFDYYTWGNFFNLYSAQDVPLLESVHFDGHPFLYEMGTQGPGDFEAAARENGILRAPRLHSVSLPRFAPEILQLPVRWSELLELNLSYGAFSLRNILTTLRRCSELRKCSISLRSTTTAADAEGDLPPPKIIMPKLEVLTLISGSFQWDMRIVLETLITPQLCHLSYHQPFISMEWDRTAHERRLMEAFNTFLRNIKGTLQELELEAGGLSFESVTGILETVPDLERLCIASYGVLEVVTPQSVYWAIASHSPFTDKALRRFIPRVLTVQHESASPVYQMSKDATHNHLDTSDSFTLVEQTERLLTGPHASSHSGNKTIVGRLCPKLKVVDFRRAMFLEPTFLEFLRARSLRHQELDVAHLERVNVVYAPGIKSNESFTNQVLKLGKLTGIQVYLTYENPLILPAATDILQHTENMIVTPAHLGFW